MHTLRTTLTALTLLALTACGSTPATTVQEDTAPNQTHTETQQGHSPSAAGTGVCGEGDCVSLLFAGDLLVHDFLWAQAEKDAQTAGTTGMDFAPLIAEQKPYTDRADLSICQMETPVAAEDGPYAEYPSFNVPPQILTAVADTGWDVCMTASNHSIDWGTPALERTYRAIENAGMGVTGTNLTEEESTQPDIFTSANGVKIAVITGTYGLNGNIPSTPGRWTCWTLMP